MEDTCNDLTQFVSGEFASPLSYFNIAPKLNKRFALMHPDFESNLITHIFRSFEVSRITRNDVIFALVRSTEGVSYSFKQMYAYQSTYSIHSTASSLSMLILSWNKIFYLLINALHHYCVINDVIFQNYCFFCCFSNYTAFA